MSLPVGWLMPAGLGPTTCPRTSNPAVLTLDETGIKLQEAASISGKSLENLATGNRAAMMMVFDVRYGRHGNPSIPMPARCWAKAAWRDLDDIIQHALPGGDRTRTAEQTANETSTSNQERRKQHSTALGVRKHRPISRPCFPRTCHDIAIPACHFFFAAPATEVWGKTLTPCLVIDLTLLLRSAHALPWLPPGHAWPPDAFCSIWGKKTEHSLGCCCVVENPPARS